MRSRALLVFASAMLLSIGASGLSVARADTVAGACVYHLQPTGEPDSTGTVDASLVSEGCFDDTIDAVAAATEEVVELPAEFNSSALTQEAYDDAGGATASALGDVLVGEEWVNTAFSGEHAFFYADVGCNVSGYAVDFVGAEWNNRFESGKGFGSCDRNRKFGARDFGGDVLLCTPNCNDYGALDDLVSSLKWHAD